jgi:hypothetical protein
LPLPFTVVAPSGARTLGRRSDFDDPVAADDDGLVLQNPVAIHRDDVHVDEGDNGFLRPFWEYRALQGERRERQRGGSSLRGLRN